MFIQEYEVKLLVGAVLYRAADEEEEEEGADGAVAEAVLVIVCAVVGVGCVVCILWSSKGGDEI